METAQTSVFISYAHRDQSYYEELLPHLKILERKGKIACWHDRKITAGSDWSDEIAAALEAADIFLFLLSPDFIASDYCYRIEMSQAFKRHDSGRSILIPIVVRPFLLSETPFANLQALPRNAVPISTWTHRDEAWKSVTEAVLLATRKIEQQKQEFLAEFSPSTKFYSARQSLVSSQISPALLDNLNNFAHVRPDWVERWKRYVEALRNAASEHKIATCKTYDLHFRDSESSNRHIHESLSKTLELISEEDRLTKDIEDVAGLALAPTMFGLKSSADITKELHEGLVWLQKYVSKILQGIP